MNIAGAILAAEYAQSFPVFNHAIKSLKYFDDIVIATDIAIEPTMIRNKIGYLTSADYVFFLDADEIVNPNIYFTLKTILSQLPPNQVIAFPRIDVKVNYRMYTGLGLSYVCRLVPRFYKYSGFVHEAATPTFSLQYPIIHYGNSVYKQAIVKSYYTHKRWRSLKVFNWLDYFGVNTLDEYRDALLKAPDCSMYLSNINRSFYPDTTIMDTIAAELDRDVDSGV